VLLTFDTHEPEPYGRSADAGQFPLQRLRDSAGWQTVLDVTAIGQKIPALHP
jgi:hypothetical protein